MKPAVALLIAWIASAQPIPASATDAPEVLGLTLNGQATGLVGEFHRCDGQPCAMAADLVALGFVVPADLASSTQPITLAALPGVQFRVDEAAQMIFVTASNAALQTTVIGDEAQTTLTPLSPSGYGAVLNYDFLANGSKAGASAATLLDLRAFGPFGSFETGANVTLASAGQGPSVQRLNSTYTYADPNRLIRLRLGDVVTGALVWTRAIRLGGIQISRDFNLRPDLVTYPLPAFSASTVVPATVSLIANGIQQSSTTVQPGPFAVHMLPVITGAGEVSLALQDSLGRQTLVTLPFYASNELLKPGLTSFSLDAGMIREGYGTANDHYARWAASLSARHGLTDWLTMETHGETTDGLGQIGIGATVRIGALGIASAALSGSGSSRASDSAQRWGGYASLGFQRVSRRFNFSVNASFDTVGYRDIGAIRGFALPKSTLDANASFQSAHWGLFGISYISRSNYKGSVGLPFGGGILSSSESRFRIVNASYNVRLAPIVSFRLSAYQNLNARGSHGASCGLYFNFGKRGTSASLEASNDSGQSTRSASLAKSALDPGDVGYRLGAIGGNSARLSAEAEYYGQWGRLTGGVEQSAHATLGQLGARGSLSLIAGALFASDHIDDSFAVVHTGDVAHVPVQYENRPIGTTNAKGLLLVPSLLSWQNNRLSLDPLRLPPDVVVGQIFTIVRPRSGSGILVNFPIQKVHAAVIILHDSHDKPIPIGSTVEATGSPAQTVGYDGEAYLQNLKPENALRVTRPDGVVCLAHARYHPVVADIPTIGPVPCL